MDVLTRSLSELVLAKTEATQTGQAIHQFIEGVSALLALVADGEMSAAKVARHQLLIKQASALSFGLPVPCSVLWAVAESRGKNWTPRHLALVAVIGRVITTPSFDHATLSSHFLSLGQHLEQAAAEGNVPLQIYDLSSSALKVVAHYMR